MSDWWTNTFPVWSFALEKVTCDVSLENGGPDAAHLLHDRRLFGGGDDLFLRPGVLAVRLRLHELALDLQQKFSITVNKMTTLISIRLLHREAAKKFYF